MESMPFIVLFGIVYKYFICFNNEYHEKSNSLNKVTINQNFQTY